MRLFYLFIFLSFNVSANIQVTPMKVSVDSSDGSYIKVKSLSSDVQYIEVEPKKILFPAMADQSEANYDYSDGTSLIVSPRKMILPAGSTRLIKLISPKYPYKDAVYRIYIKGIPGGNKKIMDDKASLSIMISWGVVAIVAAKHPSYKLTVEDKKILNEGNSRVTINKVSYCNINKVCIDSEINKSLYPEGDRPLNKRFYKNAVSVKVTYSTEIKPNNVLESKI